MVFQRNAPAAKLVAVSAAARAALAGRSEVPMTAFPFNVGRESRLHVETWLERIERRLRRAPALNDLYLVEPPSPVYHVSREHFSIAVQDGRFVFIDRESACGSIVAGGQVGGGRSQAEVDLNNGDEIVVGAAHSPYVFRFEITV